MGANEGGERGDKKHIDMLQRQRTRLERKKGI